MFYHWKIELAGISLGKKKMPQSQKYTFWGEVPKNLKNISFPLLLQSITLLLRYQPVELKMSLSPFWRLEMSVMLFCMFALIAFGKKIWNVKKNSFKCTKFTIKS